MIQTPEPTERVPQDRRRSRIAYVLGLVLGVLIVLFAWTAVRQVTLNLGTNRLIVGGQGTRDWMPQGLHFESHQHGFLRGWIFTLRVRDYAYVVFWETL